MSSMYQQFQQAILPILPELVVIVVALSVLVLDFFVEKERKAILGWYSLGGIIIAAYASYQVDGHERGLSLTARSCSILFPRTSSLSSIVPAASASWCPSTT